MLAHKEVDISGAVCPKCHKKGGVAKVAFRPPKRYFWGCSRFPLCKGPSAWNWLEVPEAQRDECDAAYKVSQESNTGQDKVIGRRGTAAQRVPSDLEITISASRVKKAKTEEAKVGSSCLPFFWVLTLASLQGAKEMMLI